MPPPKIIGDQKYQDLGQLEGTGLPEASWTTVGWLARCGKSKRNLRLSVLAETLREGDMIPDIKLPGHWQKQIISVENTAKLLCFTIAHSCFLLQEHS